VICTPPAAARAQTIAVRALDRGRAVRCTVHGDGPADPRSTGRTRAGRAERNGARPTYTPIAPRRPRYTAQMRRHSVVETDTAPACCSR